MRPCQLADQGDRDATNRVFSLLAARGMAEDRPSPAAVASERDEIARAKRNPVEFAPLYERYADAVFIYCLRRIDDREAAADLTAQIFMRALGGLSRYTDRGGSFRSWLFSSAHNLLVDTYRTRREHASLEADDLGRTLAHPGHGPERIAIHGHDYLRHRGEKFTGNPGHDAGRGSDPWMRRAFAISPRGRGSPRGESCGRR